jgi:hypothetical protein
VETNLGGSLLPCRGQEAPQNALNVGSHKADPRVNACLHGQTHVRPTHRQIRAHVRDRWLIEFNDHVDV